MTSGDLEAAIELIEAGASLDDLPQGLVKEKDPQSGQTLLHVAAAVGNELAARALIGLGAEISAKDLGDSATPLHYAAERNRVPVVRLLVEAGADLNANDDLHERGPLGWSVVFGDVNREVAEYLIDHGARPDLFTLIALGDLDGTRRLVDADPSQLEKRMSEFERFQTPVEFAARKKQKSIALWLASHNGSILISEAAGVGDEETVRELSLTATTEELERALWIAVESGEVGSARALLERGANPNAFLGVTPLLFLSIGAADEAMSRVLIEYGADIELHDRQWDSPPLGWQVYLGNPAATDLALRLGAKVTPNLLDLAKAGERGELRRFSSGTPEGYRKVADLLATNS